MTVLREGKKRGDCMVCPYCGMRVRWNRYFYRILEEHDIKTTCRYCNRIVTITKADGEHQKELSLLTRHMRNREEGLCEVCGLRKPKAGYFTCEQCIERRNKGNAKRDRSKAKRVDIRIDIPKKLYEYRRELGLCVICGEPSKKSAKFCDKCKEKMRKERQ